MTEGCALCPPNIRSAGEMIVDFGHFALLLHPDSAVAGHAMLIAARHIENFADLTAEEAQQFARAQRVAERALLDVTGAHRAILMKLGIQTAHLHIHIYPVGRDADRATVMQIIDARVREDRPANFTDTLRQRVRDLTAQMT